MSMRVNSQFPTPNSQSLPGRSTLISLGVGSWELGVIGALLFALAAVLLSAQSDKPAGPDIIVTLLGTGNPRPAPDRFGPSILVEAGSERLLVDSGRGNTIRLFE